MAHTINLTDGTTTVDLYDLVGDGIFVTGWDLQTPGTGADAETEIGEGLDVLIQASTAAALQTLVRSVEGLLWAADLRRRTGLGARVYLQVQWDGESSLWRSEVLGGKLEVLGAPDQWGRKKLEGTLAITRAAWWEGPETQIPLTNANGTANTSGLTVYNHDDTGTGHDNYVQAAAADVGGVLPGPVKVELKNTSSAAVDYTNVYLANNALAGGATLAHMLEGESRVSGYGTIVADATSSGGNYNERSFTSSGYADMQFSLSATRLQKTAGRWFRLLSRFYFLSVGATVQPILLDSATGAPLWRGATYQQVSPTNFPLIDLGAVPLPPAGYATNWDALRLALRFSTTLAGTSVADLDFVQLTPTDALRHLRLFGYPIANNDSIIDDAIAGLTYISRAGGLAPLAAPRGEPLLVFPGVDQRIYILCDEDDQTMNIDRTFAVRLWHRPRRLTI